MSAVETVTVERPGGTDRYGDSLPAATRTVAGCIFAPRSSAEGSALGGRVLGTPNTVITGITGYLPADAAITATDVIVRPDGTRWQVEGEPGLWASPFTGWSPGLEVALVRVEG